MKSFFLNIWSITIAIIILLLIGIWLLINKNIFAVEDALIKKYLVSNEYDTHQKKLSDIQNQFQLNKRTLEEKCHQIIKYLT